MVLSDSQATLRQVEGALADFSEGAATIDVASLVSNMEEQPEVLRELVQVLVRTYTEIMDVIQSLRESRGQLEEAAVERLKITHTKLEEVSSATELAATGMLDGLDRALALVDDIESTSGDDAAEHRDSLRDELHQMMNLLQFQDITAQQLGYATGVLHDIEARMLRLVNAFDLGEMDLQRLTGSLAKSVDPSVCDPDATFHNPEERQAVADQIFPKSAG